MLERYSHLFVTAALAIASFLLRIVISSRYTYRSLTLRVDEGRDLLYTVDRGSKHG